VARTGTVLLTAPLELVRTNVQSRAKSSVTDGTFALLRHVVRTEGVRGLHRGVLPTLWRDVPFSAIYWFLYEQSLKSLAVRAKRSGWRSDSADREPFLVYFAAGGVSGSAAAMITHPFDVVKTRRQMYLARVAQSSDAMANYPSTMTGIMKAIVRDEGAVGLYKGLAPRLTKVAPACAIMIASYNFCLDSIHHWNMAQAQKKHETQ
jgi:solute carrier family 25 protein 39/40